MKWKTLTNPVLAAGLLASALYAATPHPSAPTSPVGTPRYDTAGRLLVPQDYR